jgi:ribonuclease HI
MSWVELIPVLRREVTSTVKFYGSKNKSVERGCLIDTLANMITSWRTMPGHQLPFMLAKRRHHGPIILIDPVPPNLTVVHGHLNIATDGSFDITTNTAGIGVTDGVNTMFGPVPGKQSIDRAEAFGILTALQYVSRSAPSSPLKMWTDSRSTIDAINRAQDTGRYQPKLQKMISNHSIISSIVHELTKRSLRGIETQIEWVKSHTDACSHTEIQYVLNRMADHAANLGRLAATTQASPPPNICIDECYEHLPSFYLTVGRHILEHGAHSSIMQCLMHVSMQNTYENARLTGRKNIFNLSSPAQWKEAAVSPKLTKTRTYAALNAFKIKLACNSLRTPYMIFKSNDKKYPDLGSTAMCELCGQHDKPDEYHYLCKCPGQQNTLIKARYTSILRLVGHIRDHNTSVVQPPFNFIYSVMFPESKEDYTFGLVPRRVQAWLTMRDSNVTTADLKVIEANIQIWASTMYKDIWNECTNQLHKHGITLAARLKSKYGMTTDGMSMHSTQANNHTMSAQEAEHMYVRDDESHQTSRRHTGGLHVLSHAHTAPTPA